VPAACTLPVRVRTACVLVLLTGSARTLVAQSLFINEWPLKVSLVLLTRCERKILGAGGADRRRGRRPVWDYTPDPLGQIAQPSSLPTLARIS
jgi:hypothetical protein